MFEFNIGEHVMVVGEKEISIIDARCLEEYVYGKYTSYRVYKLDQESREYDRKWFNESCLYRVD